MNVHDRYHFTPLMKCAANGYTDALQLMCSSSVDINKQDEVAIISFFPVPYFKFDHNASFDHKYVFVRHGNK